MQEHTSAPLWIRAVGTPHVEVLLAALSAFLGSMAITISVEVSEGGLRAARDEIHAFLSHESTRTEAAAHLSYVVLRRLVMQIDQTIAAIDSKAKRGSPAPEPIHSELRWVA